MTKPMSARELAGAIWSLRDACTYGTAEFSGQWEKSVAEAEQWEAAIRAEAVAGERERCAKVIEADMIATNTTVRRIAAAIRGTP